MLLNQKGFFYKHSFEILLFIKENIFFFVSWQQNGNNFFFFLISYGNNKKNNFRHFLPVSFAINLKKSIYL